MNLIGLANKITKALLPDLYGKPALSTEQVVVLMGTRELVLRIINENITDLAEAKQQDAQFLATVIDARQTWIEENPGEDGRDQVTPFDKFLYGTPQTAPLCEECGIELGERIGALVVKRD